MPRSHPNPRKPTVSRRWGPTLDGNPNRIPHNPVHPRAFERKMKNLKSEMKSVPLCASLTIPQAAIAARTGSRHARRNHPASPNTPAAPSTPAQAFDQFTFPGCGDAFESDANYAAFERVLQKSASDPFSPFDIAQGIDPIHE